MRMVGAYEAKTHLSSLLDAVQSGEKIVITRNGQPVALLSPCVSEKPAVNEVIEKLIAFRHGIFLGDDLSIEDLKKEGRR